MTLVWLSLAWGAGLVLASWLRLAAPWWTIPAVAGLLVAISGHSASRRRLVGLLLLAAALGGARWSLAQPHWDARHLAWYNDQGAVTIRGHISAEPSVRATYTQLQFTAAAIQRDGTWEPVRGKAVLSVAHYPAYAYGDRLEVSGRLETPPILDDFSYRDYLAAQGVHSLLRRPSLVRLEGTDGSPLLRWMYARKAGLRRVIESILPYPDAGLLLGVLLGLGHTLPEELADAFRRTGLTHIIVISGYNLALVAQAVLGASKRLLHRWGALWGSLGAIALFTLFVGPSAPVMRAALMIAVTIVGLLLGRKSHALTSLAFASVIMTAANPLLLWGVSFQLSFVATLALIALEPLLERSLLAGAAAGNDAPVPWAALARDLLLATLAAQLATLPVIWYHFQEISLVALLANALVLPAQPAIMLLGALATALGTMWLPAGRVAAWLAWPFLRYSLVVIQRLAQAPGAAVSVPRTLAAGLALAVALGALGWWVWRHARGVHPSTPRQGGSHLKPAATRGLFLSLGIPALAAVVVWSATLGLPDGRLHLYFLDVGQGDAILIRSPSGRMLLVDGGADAVLLRSRLGQTLPFWQRRIDLVVATHADADHIAGLISVLSDYQVAQALQAPTMGEGALASEWDSALARESLRPASATAGLRIASGDGLSMQVLHPQPNAPASGAGDNAGSVVLRVEYGRFAALLAADVTAQVEAELLARDAPLGATALRVAHHGAAASTSGPFLEAVNPQVAVVSVGADNTFGHPSAAVLDRLANAGCEVLRTDRHGTVELITDGERLWISTARRG